MMPSSQIPATTASGSQINAMLDRFRLASMAAATRAADVLQSGLSLLSHQMQRPKTGAWQGETGWVLDGLKNNALDGLDAQEHLGAKSAEDKKRDQQELVQSGRLAKQALLSSASPIASAVELQKNIGGFTAKCSQILTDLRALTQDDSESDSYYQTHGRRARASEKEESSPGKSGL